VFALARENSLQVDQAVSARDFDLFNPLLSIFDQLVKETCQNGLPGFFFQFDLGLLQGLPISFELAKPFKDFLSLHEKQFL
jgi:hypothetical protein